MQAKNLNFNRYIYILNYQSNKIVHLAPSFLPFKMIYFIYTGDVGTASQRNSCTQLMAIRQLRHGDTIITSNKHDKQIWSLAELNVSPPKARVGSCDCVMFCTEKCKFLKC